MAEPEQIIYHNFWLEQELAEEGDPTPAPRLRGDRRCDVAIVGGRYAGLWTAIDLKRRDSSLEVVLIVKEICGWGGSGRNASYLLNMWDKFPNMRRLFGPERVLAASHAADQALEEVISFCAEHGIDTEIRWAGWLWGATLPETVGAWRLIMEALAPNQVAPLRELAGEEIADRWGIT